MDVPVRLQRGLAIRLLALFLAFFLTSSLSHEGASVLLELSTSIYCLTLLTVASCHGEVYLFLVVRFAFLQQSQCSERSAAPCLQFVPGPRLDDPAAVHDVNHVGVARHRQPVGDDD